MAAVARPHRTTADGRGQARGLHRVPRAPRLHKQRCVSGRLFEGAQLIIREASDIRITAMLQLDGAETMGMKAVDVLQHIDFENLNRQQKAALKKSLNDHKKHLKKSMDAVDKALSELTK
ncbi:MAG: hypothetical protein JO228_13270 [Xanthobacteraceae bacterium]|nr:hypothetical protein [Xanthobacteraceae bacterium]